jgi:hypothetical protein
MIGLAGVDIAGASGLVIRAARPDEAAALTDLAMRSKAYWGYGASFLARCRAALEVKTAAAGGRVSDFGPDRVLPVFRVRLSTA